MKIFDFITLRFYIRKSQLKWILTISVLFSRAREAAGKFVDFYVFPFRFGGIFPGLGGLRGLVGVPPCQGIVDTPWRVRKADSPLPSGGGGEKCNKKRITPNIGKCTLHILDPASTGDLGHPHPSLGVRACPPIYELSYLRIINFATHKLTYHFWPIAIIFV